MTSSLGWVGYQNSPNFSFPLKPIADLLTCNYYRGGWTELSDLSLVFQAFRPEWGEPDPAVCVSTFGSGSSTAPEQTVPGLYPEWPPELPCLPQVFFQKRSSWTELHKCGHKLCGGQWPSWTHGIKKAKEGIHLCSSAFLSSILGRENWHTVD